MDEQELLQHLFNLILAQFGNVERPQYVVQ